MAMVKDGVARFVVTIPERAWNLVISEIAYVYETMGIKLTPSEIVTLVLLEYLPRPRESEDAAVESNSSLSSPPPLRARARLRKSH